MRRRLGITDSEDPRAIRLAWWASFFATLVLIAALAIARSAQALTLPVASAGAGGSLLAGAVPGDETESEAEEAEAEELEAEECEASESEEGEEGAEEECEAGAGSGSEAARQCVLSSASASVSASTASATVRLAIHYTAFSPGAVDVTYWLRGSKGPLSLGRDRDQLGKKGVLRQTEKLGEAQMTRALAARSFTVELRPAHAPRYCDSLLDRHLTVRHAVGGHLTWSDPESGFRASRQP
jgi:hypothetical protein